jgi:DNA adenine methylase
VEPFLGSGAVFFYVVQNLSPRACTLLDANEELIHTWREIRDNVGEVIEILEEHKAHHNRESITEEERKAYYYGIRAQAPTRSAERAARFIYLNKTCFNGLHRLNAKGQFNVPMGRYKSPTIYDADHLKQVSGLLQNVTLEVCPFQECSSYISRGDFVYFDPPYEPLSRTSHFTRYTKNDFTPENQRELRDVLRRLLGSCDWMMSNSTAPLIDELYCASEFHKQDVSAQRAINSVVRGRGRIKERVITSYPCGVTLEGAG